MKFQVQSPTSIEATTTYDDKSKSMGVTPVHIRGQTTVRVVYVTAIGDNGNQVSALLQFNGRTGLFSLSPLTTADAAYEFDQTPAAFEKAQQERQAKHKPASETEEA